MRRNVIPEPELQKRIGAGALDVQDRVALALADALAGLFPAAAVYTGPVRQGVKLPAWFVGFQSFSNARMLDDLIRYEYGFDLAYWPGESRSSAALYGALQTALRGLHSLSREEERFAVHRLNGAVADRVGHVTGAVSVLELAVPDDPYIQKAEREVTI